jgi:serine/threonine protein kinase/dipeptidyl aminopeptidase/acylaminoacyl peptidase
MLLGLGSLLPQYTNQTNKGLRGMIGKTVSHYRFIKKIGEGGMGEVYLAEDFKLKRQVAIKILPSKIMVNETDKARFLQEAQSAAAISHPNVCVIYDIQDEGYPPFIVMEYVDGLTLLEKKKCGKLNVPDIIDYAIQIAEALQAAHEKNIIHRDIKSDNIMIATNNQIKVMDFGLAKIKGSLRVKEDADVAGTLAYMSPEQIEGREIDVRSDIYSFGVVLYEMLAGQMPFKGEYESALIYTILNEEPEPIQKLRPDISSELMHVLNRAMEKDSNDRYKGIDDLLIDLRRVWKDYKKFMAKTIVPSAHEETKRKVHTLTQLTIVTLVLVIIFGFIYVLNLFTTKGEPLLKSVPFTSLTGHEIYPEFSPDGNQIVFSWDGIHQNNYDLYVKSIGSELLQRLTDLPAGVWSPAWSPDGRSIAFCQYYQDRLGIFVVPSEGGEVWQLHKGNWENLYKLSWSPDSQYLAISGRLSNQQLPSIYLLSVRQGELHKLTSPPIQYFGDFNCTFSPDGKRVAFNRDVSIETGDIYIMSMPDGKPKQITFDNSVIAGISWTQDSRDIIFSSNRDGIRGLWRVSAKGGDPEPLGISGEYIESPVISRMGNHLAYVEYSYNRNIYRIAIPKSEQSHLKIQKFISSNKVDFQAEYSPDGSKIAFISFRSGSREIWVSDSSGQNPQILISLGRSLGGSAKWSPDSKQIAFDNRPEGHGDIFVANTEGGIHKRLTISESDDIVPCWSKNGDWIYFASNRSGVFQIWKISLTDGIPTQITENGGYAPRLSSDGNWIYYSRSESASEIFKLAVTGGNEYLIHNNPVNWYDWCLGDKGIYYINRKEGNSVIEFFNFSTRRKEKIAGVEIRGWAFPTISPDGKYLLYSHVDHSDSDIILIENFQ